MWAPRAWMRDGRGLTLMVCGHCGKRIVRPGLIFAVVNEHTTSRGKRLHAEA
jgi:hypothetical protein